MKKILLISLFCIAVHMQSMASHLLGAEITYTHIANYKYNVFVTVYRDCNECKIAGGGGGSNTKDCGKVELHLKTSGVNGCSSKSLTKYSRNLSCVSVCLACVGVPVCVCLCVWLAWVGVPV